MGLLWQGLYGEYSSVNSSMMVSEICSLDRDENIGEYPPNLPSII